MFGVCCWLSSSSSRKCACSKIGHFFFYVLQEIIIPHTRSVLVKINICGFICSAEWKFSRYKKLYVSLAVASQNFCSSKRLACHTLCAGNVILKQYEQLKVRQKNKFKDVSVWPILIAGSLIFLRSVLAILRTRASAESAAEYQFIFKCIKKRLFLHAEHARTQFCTMYSQL